MMSRALLAAFLTMIVIALVVAVCHAQAPSSTIPIPGGARVANPFPAVMVPATDQTISVLVTPGHTVVIDAPSERLTTHPGYRKGFTTIEIDIRPTIAAPAPAAK